MKLLSKEVLESIAEIESNRLLIHSFLSGTQAMVKDILYTNYETDWNKLIRVIEKIEELNYRVTICFENCYIERCSEDGSPTGDDGEDEQIIEGFGHTKIECVYSAVIDFIVWYNKNK